MIREFKDSVTVHPLQETRASCTATLELIFPDIQVFDFTTQITFFVKLLKVFFSFLRQKQILLHVAITSPPPWIISLGLRIPNCCIVALTTAIWCTRSTLFSISWRQLSSYRGMVCWVYGIGLRDPSLIFSYHPLPTLKLGAPTPHVATICRPGWWRSAFAYATHL